MHKDCAIYFGRCVHTSRRLAAIPSSQLERHGGAATASRCESKSRERIMGLEVLFAFVAFGTVSFIWAIAPEKASS
jgi:hypothetical protein